jgi:hypothetical protein
MDFGALEAASITESLSLQLRFVFYNLFNRSGLGEVDSNLPGGTCGKAKPQFGPRRLQSAANLPV